MLEVGYFIETTNIIFLYGILYSFFIEVIGRLDLTLFCSEIKGTYNLSMEKCTTGYEQIISYLLFIPLRFSASLVRAMGE